MHPCEENKDGCRELLTLPRIIHAKQNIGLNTLDYLPDRNFEKKKKKKTENVRYFSSSMRIPLDLIKSCPKSFKVNWPLPSWDHVGSNRGRIFKMFRMAFHAYHISLGHKDHKKYKILLYVRLMVKYILTKGHSKVKLGQIFQNVWFAWMAWQIVLHITKNIYSLVT